jgi:2-dehydropantoate 2-reductase
VRGRGESEIAWLNGAVVRHGAQVNVPTPVNQLLTETLMAILAGRTAWEEYRGRPERLAEALPA